MPTSGNSGCAIPSLADEVDFITIHLLPYWEDEPIGLDRREPDGTAAHREAHRRHLPEGPGALSQQEDRDRRDRLAERRPHALRRAAGPGRAGALLLDLPLARRPRAASTTTSSKPSTSTGRRARRARSAPPGACSTPSATTSSSSASRSSPSRTGAMLFALSTMPPACCCWLREPAAPAQPARRSPSSPSSPSSSRPATCRRSGSTCRAPSISSAWSASLFWALLLGLPSATPCCAASPTA